MADKLDLYVPAITPFPAPIALRWFVCTRVHTYNTIFSASCQYLFAGTECSIKTRGKQTKMEDEEEVVIKENQ